MKQSMKESLMNGFAGKLLIAAVTLGIALMGFKVVQPKISSESKDILVLIIVVVCTFLLCAMPFA